MIERRALTYASASRLPEESDRPLRVYTALVIVVAVIMIGRLWQRSVLQHDQYWKLAQRQQYTEKEIQPERGLIYTSDASTGQPALVAGNTERYALGVTPRELKDPEKLIGILNQKLGLDVNELRNKLLNQGGTSWPEGKGTWTAPLYHGLTQEQAVDLAKAINAKNEVSFDAAQGDILYFDTGMHFIREYQRDYLEGSLLANVLGYVNGSGEGQYGIEGAWQKELTGESGSVEVERDSRGRLLGDYSSLAAKNGESFVLTVDRNVQYQSEQVLDQLLKDQEADSGGVVVLGAKTGAVLSMVSRPTFDPNQYNKVPADQMAAFKNLNIGARYEFGSVFKTLTIAMAINEGLTTPDEVNDYPGYVNISGYKIKNVGEKAYPRNTTTQALEFSVNTAMIDLANRLGTDRFYDYLVKLGFGQKTGIELAGETVGYLIDRKDMHDVERATISFGQGIDTTAIQMASAYTTITNDGVMLYPHIIDSVIYPDGSVQKQETRVGPQVFTADTAQKMREMLASVVVFGHAKRAAVAGYQVGGKTGTAQMADPNGGYYTDRYRHSFALIAPADNPQFIIFMTIENPKKAEYAESTVAPASAEIAKYLLSYYQIPHNK